MIFNRARQGIAGGAAGGGGGGASYVTTPVPLILPPQRHYGGGISAASYSEIIALNEKMALVGQVLLSEGPSASAKTISAAGGGSIMWRYYGSGSTFSDPGTNVRIGIQDLDANGEPDGTFDVYADLVGGTDTLTGFNVYDTPMESGSKSISNGDIVAVTFDFTAHGGTDKVRLYSYYQNNPDANPALGGVMEYNTVSWSTDINTGANLLIKFDDGTYGLITGCFASSEQGSISYNSGDDPDEYGMLLSPPFACKCSGINTSFVFFAGATFELCLYEDPLGTPSLKEAKVFDTVDFVGAGWTDLYFDTEHILLPENQYALTIRPTSANDVTLYYYDLFEAAASVMVGFDSDKFYAVERTNNSGVFTDYNGGTAKTRHLHLSALISSIKASQT